MKSKRNDNNRPHFQRFQGTFQGFHGSRSEFQGPINKHQKPKHHQQNAANSNFDSTPVKESKNYSHVNNTNSNHGNNTNNNGNTGGNNNGNNHNNLPKRDQYVNDVPSGIIFGSNVPPFPFYASESNEPHYVPPNHPPVNGNKIIFY